MIVTQTHKRRSFIGNIDSGTDIVEGLKSICVDNTIFCGTFNVVGYLKDVEVRTFDHANKRYRDPTNYSGPFHAIAVHGNVSLNERQTSIGLHALGTMENSDGTHRIVSGELVSGKVISVEFHLHTCDDVRLYRGIDERLGMEPWRHVEFGAGKLPRAEDKKSVQAAPTAAPASRPTPAAAKPVAKATSASEPVAIAPDVHSGDYLNHPTLGQCEVINPGDEERMTIKLASGRVVELHLGLLELSRLRDGEDGHTVYKVSIRRRR